MMKSVKDFNVKDKRILVRCDFNVPLNSDGSIADDFKIKQTLPTIQYLIASQAKVILMTHLGDPEGSVVESLNLNVVKEALEHLLGVSIKKAADCIGQETKALALSLGAGEILLLENVRFHKEEKENNAEFAKELSELGEIFINNAFAECHREYASIVGIPQYLPHGAGLLLEKEIENLSQILESPKKPIVAIIGGVKVTTKTSFLRKISEVADWVLVSGLIQAELIKQNVQFEHQGKIIGPADNLQAFDISDATLKLFEEKISLAKTIIWNGPFGKIEEEQFRKGTLGIANAIIKSKALSMVGGGETVEFLNQEKLTSQFNHVSTGGGAMLDFLSGEPMPGIKALEN